ncbi:SDR family oxidoreductase [Caballeronia sp. dw_19]|uniref:SDR family NAD(P)-dependent oxidoreductase n=1 Tax=Caballeronia sp. dw_19 TaxID=2719791 RepID=UPI001BD29A33|nr:SDR family oxidoreductase [Caballeronia sp. dw_19]
MAGCDDAVHPPAQAHVGYPGDHLCRRAIGSNTAVRSSFPGSTVYATTKAAVATMVKGIALDLAPRRIIVNNIQPGPIETDITAGMISRLAEMVPLRRVGQPTEIAALVSYLASEEATYMTGSSLTIDGGFAL